MKWNGCETEIRGKKETNISNNFQTKKKKLDGWVGKRRNDALKIGVKGIWLDV